MKKIILIISIHKEGCIRLLSKSCEKCIWECQCNEDCGCEDFYYNDDEQYTEEYEFNLHTRYKDYEEIINEFN